MRTRIVLAIGALACLAYAGCDTQQADAPVPEMAVADLPPGMLALPAESETWRETTEGKTTLWFRLPDTHALMGQVESGGGIGVQRAPGGGVTCTCTDGDGGCSPFEANAGGKKWVGCAIDPDVCTECEMSAEALVAEGQPAARLLEPVVVEEGRPIKVVETHAEADALRCGSATLLRDPETVRAIAEYVRPFQGPDLPSFLATDPDLPGDDVVTAPIDVYGNVLWVPVHLRWEDTTDDAVDWPTSELMWDRYVVSEEPESVEAVPGDGPCTCLSGGGGCTYRRESAPFIGNIRFCDAQGCNSCRLDT